MSPNASYEENTEIALPEYNPAAVSPIPPYSTSSFADARGVYNPHSPSSASPVPERHQDHPYTRQFYLQSTPYGSPSSEFHPSAQQYPTSIQTQHITVPTQIHLSNHPNYPTDHNGSVTSPYSPNNYSPILDGSSREFIGGAQRTSQTRQNRAPYNVNAKSEEKSKNTRSRKPTMKASETPNTVKWMKPQGAPTPLGRRKTAPERSASTSQAGAGPSLRYVSSSPRSALSRVQASSLALPRSPLKEPFWPYRRTAALPFRNTSHDKL